MAKLLSKDAEKLLREMLDAKHIKRLMDKKFRDIESNPVAVKRLKLILDELVENHLVMCTWYADTIHEIKIPMSAERYFDEKAAAIAKEKARKEEQKRLEEEARLLEQAKKEQQLRIEEEAKLLEEAKQELKKRREEEAKLLAKAKKEKQEKEKQEEEDRQRRKAWQDEEVRLREESKKRELARLKEIEKLQLAAQKADVARQKEIERLEAAAKKAEEDRQNEIYRLQEEAKRQEHLRQEEVAKLQEQIKKQEQAQKEEEERLIKEAKAREDARIKEAMELYEEAGAGPKIMGNAKGADADSTAGSSFFLSKICDASFTIDNAVVEVKKLINEHGGEAKAEMHLVLEEAVEIIDEITQTRRTPKRKRFYMEVTKFSKNYGWFCSAIISLVGRAGMNMLGGE